MCPMRLSDGDPSRKWFHISDSVFNKIQSDVFPYARKVGLSCGAEPLTNPDFIKYLKALYKSGVPYRDLVTNGTLLTEPLIQAILKYPPTSLFFSIDGATKETHSLIRDGADLEKILRSIELIISGRGKRTFPMVGFSTTLQKDNLNEIVNLVKLAGKLGVTSIGLVPLVPYKGLNTLDKVLDLKSSEVQNILTEAQRYAKEIGVSFHLSSDISDRESAHPCNYLTDTIYIDPEGSIFPCPYWNTKFPVGNILDGFDNVWNGTKYSSLREGNFQKTDNCTNCPEITSRSIELTKDKQ